MTEEWVSVHTPDGVTVTQYGPSEMTQLTWGRQLRDVSKCELVLPPPPETPPSIAPWVHWVSVWDGNGALQWTGPVLKTSVSPDGVTISARDVAALLARTRTPIRKRWDAVNPAIPAAELWRAMIELHGLHVKVVQRPDPEADYFDITCKADEEMLDKTIGDLVGLGLRWTVVAGVPLLGPATVDPVATLGENDFLGGVEVIRDGAETFNDVLVRGPDKLAQARVPLHGLSLQTIVNIDSMFGVGNVDRAARQYARHTGAIRDAISLPSGTALHPDAPVGIEQLIPSARFVIAAHGQRYLMELEAMQRDAAADGAATTVTMESVIEKPELAELKPGQRTR